MALNTVRWGAGKVSKNVTYVGIICTDVNPKNLICDDRLIAVGKLESGRPAKVQKRRQKFAAKTKQQHQEKTSKYNREKTQNKKTFKSAQLGGKKWGEIATA